MIIDALRVEWIVRVGAGKYTLILEEYEQLYCLRYDKPWRSCVGDKFFLSLGQEIVRLRTELAKAEASQ